MTPTDLTLVTYFLAERSGRGDVDNQQMVDFLVWSTGQNGLNTVDFSNRIQRELRVNDQIENVIHGGRGGPGVFRITGPGRVRARGLLAELANRPV